MTTYRIIHTVQIVINYEAGTRAEALTKAAMDARDQTVGDLVYSACDLFVLDPKVDEDDDAARAEADTESKEA